MERNRAFVDIDIINIEISTASVIFYGHTVIYKKRKLRFYKKLDNYN